MKKLTQKLNDSDFGDFIALQCDFDEYTKKYETLIRMFTNGSIKMDENSMEISVPTMRAITNRGDYDCLIDIISNIIANMLDEAKKV